MPSPRPLPLLWRQPRPRARRRAHARAPAVPTDILSAARPLILARDAGSADRAGKPAVAAPAPAGPRRCIRWRAAERKDSAAGRSGRAPRRGRIVGAALERMRGAARPVRPSRGGPAPRDAAPPRSARPPARRSTATSRRGPSQPAGRGSPHPPPPRPGVAATGRGTGSRGGTDERCGRRQRGGLYAGFCAAPRGARRRSSIWGRRSPGGSCSRPESSGGAPVSRRTGTRSPIWPCSG